MKELSSVATELACYSLGLVTGLARETYCLAAVPKAYHAARITPQLVVQVLHPFETARLGTEVFFHNMKGPRPHWLDQDVRRLRRHFLPNSVVGKVAIFNRVPYDFFFQFARLYSKRRRVCCYVATCRSKRETGTA